MKEFCENEHCENPGAKEVHVSVSKASDQVRTLCVTCEEAYTCGVQHGTMSLEESLALGHVDRFLQDSGFVVVGKNNTDASEAGSFEAWAYHGPLDFHAASPVRFGVGTSCLDVLRALDEQLAAEVEGQRLPPDTPGSRLVHPVIQRIHDLLYLDMQGSREFYNPNKSRDADTLAMIAEAVAEYIPRPTKEGAEND